MDTSDDEVDFKQVVMHTLEESGDMAAIRAQLRAKIFLALEAQKNSKFNLKQQTGKKEQSAEFELAKKIVDDFLTEFPATRSVFRPEVSLTNSDRSDLVKKLKLSSSSDEPILVQLIRERLKSPASSSRSPRSPKGGAGDLTPVVSPKTPMQQQIFQPRTSSPSSGSLLGNLPSFGAPKKGAEKATAAESLTKLKLLDDLNRKDSKDSENESSIAEELEGDPLPSDSEPNLSF